MAPENSLLLSLGPFTCKMETMPCSPAEDTFKTQVRRGVHVINCHCVLFSVLGAECGFCHSISCATLAKLLDVSEPEHPYLQNRDDNSEDQVTVVEKAL